MCVCMGFLFFVAYHLGESYVHQAESEWLMLHVLDINVALRALRVCFVVTSTLALKIYLKFLNFLVWKALSGCRLL